MANPDSPNLISPRPLQLGYVPLVDAAPLIVAKEFGLFEAAGLEVQLVREPGWAAVRDKLVLGRELDGAHALAGLAFATSYGIGCVARHCLTGYVMNRHGNAVTLSNELWRGGVQSPADLAGWMRANPGRRLRFGIVHPASSHHYLLRSMLGRAGLRLGEEAEAVVLPPELMPLNLERGRIDGFCAGEPWGSVAVEDGSGFCVATSSELCAGHPEKVLLVSSDFESRAHDEHVALIAALAAAGRICDDPEGRSEMAPLLASRSYLDVPVELVRNSLGESFHRGFDQFVSSEGFHSFSGDSVNSPSSDKSDLVLSQLRDCGLLASRPSGGPRPDEIFRTDLYQEASRREVAIGFQPA